MTIIPARQAPSACATVGKLVTLPAGEDLAALFDIEIEPERQPASAEDEYRDTCLRKWLAIEERRGYARGWAMELYKETFF